MKFYLYSKYDCLISVRDFDLKLYSGQKKVLEADLPITMHIFPICKVNQIVPCALTLFKDKNCVLSENPNVNIYKINADNCILEIEPCFVCSSSPLASLSTKTNDYEVCQSEFLQIKCANKVIKQINMVCVKADLYEQNNLVFCVLYGNDFKHLLVFDEQNNVLVDEKISQVENLENAFQTFLNLNDMQKQGIVKKYVISDDELKLESEYPVYVEQTAKPIYSQKLIPQAFFEAVRAKNLNLAKSCLSGQLANKITLPHLVSYFGKFDKIFNLSDDANFPCFALACGGENTCLLYKLSLVNGLIDNIEKL